MREIKIKKAVENIIKALYESIKRFPWTIGISGILVIMLIITNEQRPHVGKEILMILERISMIIALGIPLSLCIKLVFEKSGTFKRIHQVFIYIIGVAFLLIYYFFLLTDYNMVSTTRYIAVSIFMYLAFLYIPWFGNKEGYEFYIIKVLGSFFIAFIYSAVLYFGISAILFSIDRLFSISVDGKFYYYIFLIITGIFAPAQFLSKIPYSDWEPIDANYSKPFKVLTFYIVIPLVLTYMVILYAYFIKIIVTGIWPIGLVSHLVLWYSVITVGVIFFVYPINKENKLVEKFIFIFPKAIIPIIGLMFFSIGLRIKQYGITENRYFIVVLGLWVLGIMLYFSIAKKFKNIIIPMTLSILVINSIAGPLSSFAISKYSQNKRFEKVLIESEMLKDGKIVHGPAELSAGNKVRISMILDYFDKKHSLKDVKYIPDNFKIDDMQDLFGFQFIHARDTRKEQYFHYDSFGKRTIVDISEYDYLIEMDTMEKIQGIGQLLEASYDMENNLFILKENETIIYEKNLNEYAEKAHKKYKDIEPKTNDLIDPNVLIFAEENDRIKIKFVFKYIGGTAKSDIVQINDASFYVLIKVK